MTLLINGRAEDRPVMHKCPQPRCLKAFKAYRLPYPTCPDHGVPMKEVRRGR